jgi:uncharacterized protein YbcI
MVFVDEPLTSPWGAAVTVRPPVRDERPLAGSPGEFLAAVSDFVVGVYADCLGRGPTRSRSYKDRDVVVCLLEDTLTKPERHLREAGRNERLLDLRGALQETMREELVAGMEKLSGQRVVALISGRQLDPDIASEVFVLGPVLADGGES